MTIDIDAIRQRAGRVRFRTCEPGADHEAYELSRDAQALLAKVDELTAALERALDAKYAALGEVGQLRVQLGRVEDQLTAANRRADGLDNDLRSAVKGNTNYANENARLRRQLADIACLKCWTNEEGKRFVFVTDIQAALGVPTEAGVDR